ncbi:DNA polymerase epsilon subunit 4-like isoform X2 [Watersipora subatra]
MSSSMLVDVSTMADEPIIADASVTTDEPIIADALVTADEPIIAAAPVTTDEPIIADAPVTTDEQILTEVQEQIVEDNDVDTQDKTNRLPLSKIKLIMKTDADVSVCSTDAALAICRLTEQFIKFLAEESYRSTRASGRKTVQRKDYDDAVSAVDQLVFLDGAVSELC